MDQHKSQKSPAASMAAELSSTSVPLSAIGVLSVIGAALSALSLYEHTAQLNHIAVSVPLCTISSSLNCEVVNRSPFSLFLGLPVATWGLSFFLAQLTLSVAAHSAQNLLRNLLVGLTTSGVIFCAYLLLVSSLVIGAWCPICLGVYLITFISWILSIASAKPVTFTGAIKSSLAVLRRLLPGATPLGANYRFGVLITLFIGLIGLMTPDFLLVKLIAPAAENKQRADAESQSLEAWRASEETAQDLVTETGPMQDFGFGPISAPVQIVEFSDFQCPFCRRLAGELEELAKDFPGKIRLVARNFPLDSACNSKMPQPVHELACPAATFARCAGEQGQFPKVSLWLNELPELEESQMTQQQFEDVLLAGSKKLGLDGDAIKECRSAQRTKDKIEADATRATELGLQGTPLVLVNGRKVEYPSKNVLKQIIVEIITAGIK